MDALYNISKSKITRINTHFNRFLIDNINWKNQLIAIKGARGVGKTTLLLQYIKLHLPKNDTVLYVSMDELFFMKHSLIGLAEIFVQNGGKHLFLDEVHKYPNWSREIKLIYDRYAELQVVFTSSSVLEIYKAESDLSRRAISYILPEMSLREFIALESNIVLPSYTLDELLKNHQDITSTILDEIKPLQHYNKYIKYGAYPYFKQGIDEYHQILIQTINLIIEVDIMAVENISFLQITKIKKLLFAIATSVPFTPNISKLAAKVELSRQSLVKALHSLEKAHLLILLNKKSKGITALNKPDKLFLNNTNIMEAITANHNVGTLRETFFINQTKYNNTVYLAEKGDFIINENTFEIGGKNKTQKQIKAIKNSFIVKDSIEFGSTNSIPLWLFGFLY